MEGELYNPLGAPNDPFTGQPSVFFPPVPIAPIATVAGATVAAGAGLALAEEASAAGEICEAGWEAEATTVIGRTKDLQNLANGERSLLDRLADLGNPKANWAQNSGVLREEMSRGLPIRDAPPGDNGGVFLQAERYLLRDRGWTFDPKTAYWMPPTP